MDGSTRQMQIRKLPKKPDPDPEHIEIVPDPQQWRSQEVIEWLAEITKQLIFFIPVSQEYVRSKTVLQKY